MTKEEIIHLSSNLYEEALRAKSYFEIIKQYQRNQVEYNEQINLTIDQISIIIKFPGQKSHITNIGLTLSTLLPFAPDLLTKLK